MKQKFELDQLMLANLSPKNANDKIQEALQNISDAADLLDIGGYDKEASYVTEFLTKITS